MNQRDSSIDSLYLQELLNPIGYRKIVERLTLFLLSKRYLFDSICGSSYSSVLISPQIAYNLNKNFILIRKKNYPTSSNRMVEGYKNTKKYIIIDDLVETFSCVRRINKEMNKFAPNSICNGIFLYAQDQIQKPQKIDGIRVYFVKH
ncbi:MAG: phosphoribosyltransferase [Nanoarchaeota archaeon]